MAKASKNTVSPNMVYTKAYEKFRGVDFSQDASMVDDEHSPYAQNLISDTDGFPEKRLGWRTVEAFEQRINGIFSFGSKENNCMVVHAGTSVYKLQDGEMTELITGIADARSQGKYFKGKLCILTGEEYLVFDGEACVRAGEFEGMYAPITLMSRAGIKVGSGDVLKDATFLDWDENGVLKNKDGTEVNPGAMPDGAGVNLVSGKRKNHFEVSQTYSTLVLDGEIDVGTRVTMRCIATGEEMFSLIYDSDIGRQKYFSYSVSSEESIKTDLFIEMSTSTAPYDKPYVVIGNSKKNGCSYILCYPNLSKISGYTHIPGVDNFSIEFTHTVEGYAERIDKCTVMDVYENRLFFSGNPDYPNADWYSGVNDPLYVPDINYTEIGMDSSRIMGYLRTGSEQAILKSDGDDATIYMRSYNMLSDGKVIFPIKHGTSGIGAIAPRAVCTFLDDPLYLSRNGV